MSAESPPDYTVLTVEGISVIRQRSPMSATRLLEMFEELAALPIAARRAFVLHAEYRLSAPAMREVAAGAKRTLTGPSWTAMVTSGDLQFELMRMYGSLRDTGASDVRVFTDENEASRTDNGALHSNPRPPPSPCGAPHGIQPGPHPICPTRP